MSNPLRQATLIVAGCLSYTREMTIKTLEHVSVVVDDLPAAIAFFTTLGMALEGEMPVEGPWVDRLCGLEGVQVDITMMRTPDGHGRVELTKFRNPRPEKTGGKGRQSLSWSRRLMALRALRFSTSCRLTSLAEQTWSSPGYPDGQRFPP